MMENEGKILCCPIVTTNYPTVYDQINKDEGVIVGMNGKEIADGILKILKDPHQYSEYLSQHEYGNEKEIEGCRKKKMWYRRSLKRLRLCRTTAHRTIRISWCSRRSPIWKS